MLNETFSMIFQTVIIQNRCLCDRFYNAIMEISSSDTLCFQACFPDANTDKLESHIFRMYDTNGDGHIDFREFMIVLYIMSNGTPEENLKQVTKNFFKRLLKAKS